jgi:protein-S-isoprenylcysteine O-methyltransferase Ste14
MALAVWFARTMHSADTTLRIDKPVSSLVQNGPFRYSRNPGYLSLTMLYTGIAILRNALWAILLLPHRAAVCGGLSGGRGAALF